MSVTFKECFLEYMIESLEEEGHEDLNNSPLTMEDVEEKIKDIKNMDSEELRNIAIQSAKDNGDDELLQLFTGESPLDEGLIDDLADFAEKHFYFYLSASVFVGVLLFLGMTHPEAKELLQNSIEKIKKIAIVAEHQPPKTEEDCVRLLSSQTAINACKISIRGINTNH